MKMLMMRIRLTVLIALTLVCFGISANAADGTVQAKVLTFANTASNVVTFVVDSSVGPEEALSLKLDFAPDGDGTVLTAEPFATPASVTFALKYNGIAVPGFSFNAAGAAAGVKVPPLDTSPPVLIPGTTVPVKLIAIKDPGAVGQYTVSLTFPSGISGATADWALEIGGLPTSPSIRTLISNPLPFRGKFKTLSIAGPCTACASPNVCQAPCTGCPSGQNTCQACGANCTSPNFCHPACGPGVSICKVKPWLCEVTIFWPPKKWPWPPKCLSCPQPWQKPTPDGFDRLVLEFIPRDKAGNPLEPAQRKEVRVNIKGGELVGELIDLGDGEMTQAIQYRKGSSPRVSATVLGVTTEEVAAELDDEGGGGIYKTLTYLLFALLAAALAAVALVWRRPARG